MNRFFRMRLSTGWTCLAAALLLAVAAPCAGQGVFVGPDGKSEPRTLSLPYSFYNENFGVAAGYVYGVTGYPQKQSAVLGTLMAGTQGAAMGFFMGRDLRVPRTKRLFVDPVVSVGYFRENDAFVDGSITDRPPAYAGSTLGGLWRLRGYPSQRFSDKAAVYYAAELRMMPEWNPFDGWPWLQKHVGVQWLQLVPFAELGRVAPSWNAGELHSDMKWSLGLGARVWAKGIVARIDTAFSDEDFKIQMMVGQPFQF